MKTRLPLLLVAVISIAAGQTTSTAVVVNLDTTNWTHEKGAPDGSEGAMVRVDQTTGGVDLLVRFPAGHVIPPHFHDSNERIFVAEGQLTLHQETGDMLIKPGGYAFLPAHEIQRLSCSSTTRCTFYHDDAILLRTACCF